MQVSCQINEIIKRHLEKARALESDARVAVLAVAAARGAIRRCPEDCDPETYAENVLKALEKLEQVYNDPEGEYTSGKAEIRAIIEDVRRLAS